MTEIDPNKVHLTEEDIEDWLYENPGALRTIPRRRVTQWIARQYKVPSGVIDLLGIDEGGFAVVVEIKNAEINSQALAQVCRYATDIEEILARVQGIRTPIPFKIAIGKGDLSSKHLYEAYALGISVHSFDVELSLEISGRWHWTKEAKQDHKRVYEELSQSEEFEIFPQEQKVDENLISIVDEAREIIDQESDEG